MKIYDLYPRKVERKRALKAIRTALNELAKRDDIDDPVAWLTGVVQQYAQAVSAWPEERRQFISHPATWFNGERYDDDQATWVGHVSGPATSAPQHVDLPPEPNEEEEGYARFLAARQGGGA